METTKTPVASNKRLRGWNAGRLGMIAKNAELIFDSVEDEELLELMLSIIDTANRAKAIL